MKNNFCIAPWVSISTDVNGSIRPCCRYEQPKKQTKHKMPWMKNGNLNELWNGPEMKKLREAFLYNERPDECKWCWDEEQSGVESFRQKYMRRANIDVESTHADPPVILDFKLSNVCNLKCRMCGPMASSKILKEYKRSYDKEFLDEDYWLSNKILETDNEEIFFDHWLPNIRELEFTGGEPFFSPENKAMIKKISETEWAEDIDILITTNGTIFDKKTLWNLRAFKRVRISLSIDDIGPRLEYQRNGSDWDIIKKNIQKISKEFFDFNVAIYRTINNYNIWYLEELEEYASTMGITIIDGFLHDPSHLSIRNLPDYIKHDIELLYGDSESKKKVLQFLNLPAIQEDWTKRFTAETLKVDLLRGENFQQTFPEWWEVIMNV